MKNIKKYLGLMLAAVMAGLSTGACQDDFDAPAIKVPVAALKPNATIATIKALYWNDKDNYIDTIKVGAANEPIVIAGRVISSDASGNIYKSLVIQDNTGALAMSINANSLYSTYRIGQEVVINLSDMYIGKYSTLQQLGFPDYSSAYGWQATFMPLEFFKRHSELNGLPEPSKIDTLTVSIPELSNDAASLRTYQSQLVRINNVSFVDGGEKSFCDAHKVNTNRTLKDANGNEIIVRTSGYANFWSAKLPAESGDVVGILSTFKKSGELKWQLLLRSTDDLLNFGNPTLPKGTETNPYDVLEGIDFADAGSTQSAWFTGYIVGSVKAGVSEVTSVDDIEWSADAETLSTLVIGQTAESRSLTDCMLITLPSGSDLSTYGNLLDHPENYLRQIWILGRPGNVLGMNAFTDNNGSKTEWRIEGVTVPGGSTDPVAEGTGTEESPYNPTQVLAKGKTVNETGKWVKGYIVGYIPDKKLEEAVFGTPATSATNILIATTPTETSASNCVPVQLPAGDVRTNLNLQDNPGNLGKVCTLYGDLIAYFGVAGVKNTSKYIIDGTGGGDNPNPPSGEVVTSFNETFDDATKFPTASGWTITNTSGNASWFIRTADNNNPTNCAEVTAYGSSKTPGADGFISWLVSPGLDVDKMTEKVLSFKSKVGYSGNGTLEVFAMTSADPATATLTQLNATIVQPSGSWSDFTPSGNISLAQFSGVIYIGFRYKAASGSNYTTYRVDDIVAGSGGGGGDTPTPPVTGSNSADLNTLTTSSSYGTYTTTNGWVATNCAVQSGGAQDSNPVFTFIGSSADVKAVCLNGKSGAAGSLVSPTLTGGISKLTFKYGFAFSDKQCKFTINIKQGGTTVQTKTVDLDTVTKLQANDFEWAVSVSGDFQIEIVNDCKTGTAKNVDRVSIWDIQWNN